MPSHEHPPTHTRRSWLRLSGVALVGGLAGCSALSGDSPMVDLTVFNHSESPFTIELTMYQPDGDHRSDARAYSTSVDVDSEAEANRTDVAEKRPYLVQYSAYENNSRLTDEDHVHYLPSDGPDDGHLTFDVDRNGVLTRR